MASRLNRRASTYLLRRKRRRRRKTFATSRRFLRSRWHALYAVTKAVLASPPTVRTVVTLAVILIGWLGVNWTYHAFNKPSEVLFPLDHSLNKSPAETWNHYGPLFRRHSTTVITPELLAALAQVEGGGNPVARTYWRWNRSWNPLEWYQPASSAVGMYQITDGTFHEATRYCIRDHVVVEDGPWHDLQSCWFNSFYQRVVPSHAIELTAARLDRRVAQAVESRRIGTVTLQQKQNLAAVVHLCGAGAGHAYAARGFRTAPHQRCGDHDVQAYLTRVNAMKRQFAQLEAGGKRFRLVSSR